MKRFQEGVVVSREPFRPNKELIQQSLRTEVDGAVAKPFLKWVGGKSKLAPLLVQMRPKKFRRYIEPFVGGGAMFYAMQPYLSPEYFPAVLNDSNDDLITTYSVVRYNLPELVTALVKHAKNYFARSLDGQRTYFEAVRSMHFAGRNSVGTRTRVEIAARFIFLNKTCFNGLYRVNQRGEFNVPHGSFKSPPRICDVETLRNASLALENVLFSPGDFEKCFHTNAEPGDFIYADPPYIPLTATSNFTSYARAGFTYRDQVRLCNAAVAAMNRGVFVLLSNSSSEIARELYSDRKSFEVTEVDMRRNINSKGDSRGTVKELVIQTKTKGWC